MFLLSQASNDPGILASLFGGILNWIFEFVYNISPHYSLGFAIILFTILAKLLLLPLAIKQQVSTKRTQKMQPELKALQDKYKNKKDADSQQEMAKEMQAIYSKHGTNPMAGCLVSLIQIPIILALFGILRSAYMYIGRLKDIYVSITAQIMSAPGFENILGGFEKATKLKITDFSLGENVQHLLSNFSQADWGTLVTEMPQNIGSQITTLIEQKNQIEMFCGINLTSPPVLMGISVIIPILVVLTTWLSMKLVNRQQQEGMDEQTANMMKSMNNMSTIMIALIFVSSFNFPAGVGLYWILNSFIQIIQQKLFAKYIK